MVKNLPANAGDTRDVVLIPWSGGAPGEGNGNPWCSCLENPLDREAWQTTVHGVAKSQPPLKRQSTQVILALIFISGDKREVEEKSCYKKNLQGLPWQSSG